MALGLQSLYRWDNLIQSEVHEIAISPQGNFFAVAASQGGVFVFDAGTGQAIHAIQLRINEQPLSCLWSSHPVEGENTTELELFLGTSAGIVASVRLDAMVSLYSTKVPHELAPNRNFAEISRQDSMGHRPFPRSGCPTGRLRSRLPQGTLGRRLR